MLTAEDALTWGLLNYVEPDYGTAFQRSVDLCKEINKKGPLGVRNAKSAVNASLDLPIEEGLRFEEKCYSNIVATEDRREGLKAFVEKRKPIYQGK